MLENGKAKITDDFNGLKIKCSAKRNWFTTLFLMFWLGGWYVGFTTVFHSLLNNENFSDNLFLLFWICGWTVGGIYVISLVPWSLFGKEMIEIQNNTFSIKKSIFNIGKTSCFPLSEIKNIRLDLENKTHNPRKDGMIKIDAGFKTYHIAANLEEAEATYIIQLLQKKLPYNQK